MLEAILLSIVLGFGFNVLVSEDTCQVSQDVEVQGVVYTVSDTYKQDYCNSLLEEGFTRETKVK